MNTALIVIDIQEDYFPNGKFPLSNPENAANNAQKVLEYFRSNHSENIFHIQHIAPDDSFGFFEPNTEGIEIYEAVKPKNNETVINKQLPNSFINTDLQEKLQEKNIDNVVVVGMMTQMCVDATVRAAADLGYKVTLIEDACASSELIYKEHTVSAKDVHYSFISALKFAYAEVYTVADFMDQK
ncbi:cysteine hydrolase family protein [Staphylococcus sp. NAM3COL9]|uniref:cysteine hydrolase family protein n=1 Tax=Staphylococcus sp. NAM3COL9 TaxID=1667172 RepID=UPI0007091852|nr:cysteine hydrolase family protein [Staphylococcus sp. NAM3COL9]KRG10809.1 isochorismatase [Staphylococcus sp. NAM3COL9]